MKKKKKLFIVLGALVLLAVIILVIDSQPNEYERNYEDVNSNKPYSMKEPLHEADLDTYKNYVEVAHTLLGNVNYVRKIELPCDVKYYERKEDSKPALTLKKGTEVYVLAEDNFDKPGYGWCCWPDYEKGWRYGIPFLTQDFKEYPKDTKMYYVKLNQLEKVCGAFYDANKDPIAKYLSKKEYIEEHTLKIDERLCFNGFFLSNELRDK